MSIMKTLGLVQLESLICTVFASLLFSVGLASETAVKEIESARDRHRVELKPIFEEEKAQGDVKDAADCLVWKS